MRRFFGKNDIILAAVLLSVSFAALLLLRPGMSGSLAEVSVDGRPWAEYSLSEDRSVRIETEYGINVLEIKDGCVRISEADCPNRDCVRSGPASREGQLIVCLPHRLVVNIKGGDGYDAVTY